MRPGLDALQLLVRPRDGCNVPEARAVPDSWTRSAHFGVAGGLRYLISHSRVAGDCLGKNSGVSSELSQ
jgi:hypothetical protein